MNIYCISKRQMIHTVNVQTKKGCHSASPNPCVYLVESYCSMAAILFSAEYVYFQTAIPDNHKFLNYLLLLFQLSNTILPKLLLLRESCRITSFFDRLQTVRPPSKNGHKKASKNEMNRSISLIY